MGIDGMGKTLRLALAVLALATFACSKSGESQPAASPAPASSEDPGCSENKTEDAARVGVAGAKTGLTTAADAFVQAGSSAAGLVHGGTDEAKQRWKEGGQRTNATARAGGAETKREARTPRCK